MPLSSSSSEDELRMGTMRFRSSTTPRSSKSHSKSSPKNRYKSSENILDSVNAGSSSKAGSKKVGNLSEGELLEDKSSIFDFTSNRAKANAKNQAFDYLLKKSSTPVKTAAEKPVNVESAKQEEEAKKSNNDSNSDKSHEPFGSTEFPTLKRNLKMSTPNPPPVQLAENEYESMTSIRNSVWTPTDNAGAKTVDGLSSPSVIGGQDAKTMDPGAEAETAQAIEPPPNFGSCHSSPKDKPPPLPSKKYAIKPNKHETQFHATLQRSSKHQSPKMESKKSNAEKVIIQPNQIRMASLQASQEIKQRQQRSKRIRNRSLEMVLDENRSSDSSPSRKR